MENDDYIKSSNYGDLYFDTLNPNFINLNLLLAGFKPTRCRDYLELGFGMGRSLITHAVSNVGNFIGTDFSQSQVAFAEKIRQKARISNLTLYDDSFEELLERLRKMRASGEKVGFDFIVLHGIYSWINYENRQIILSIIEEFLRDGGVVYMSYNCLPGRAKTMDARHIFKQYSHNHNTEDFKKIFAFTEKFAKLNPESEKNKNILSAISRYSHDHPTYLAHEFLNNSWYLPYFSDVAQAMQKRGLKWACEDVLAYHFKHFSPEQEKFLEDLQDKIFKEQMRDFIIDKDFRFDLYVKNATILSQNELFTQLLDAKFVLINYPTSQTFKNCAEDLKWTYIELISKLESEDFAPKSIKDLLPPDADIIVLYALLSNLITLKLIDLCVPAYADNIQSVKFYNHALLKSQKLSHEYIFACALTGGGGIGG